MKRTGVGRGVWVGVLAAACLAAPALAQDTGGGESGPETSATDQDVDRAVDRAGGRSVEQAAGLDPAQEEAAKEARAAEALASIEGLSGVRVEVSGELVRLEGVADDPLVLERASAAALAATGAARVQNDITLTSDFSERLHGAANRLGGRVEQWIA
ncbi:MAG: hypothetical protein ACF8LK_01665, partial [Phycisphaerales bacterium JB041]